MITVVSHFPSPYQVEFFNAISKAQSEKFRVLYLYRQDPMRSWGKKLIEHDHAYLDFLEPSGISKQEVFRWIIESSLVVFNYYNHPRITSLIDLRASQNQPWVLWGERPGYQHPYLGRILRYWMLRHLRASNHPIWGIGNFAVAAYQAEFGLRRHYFNIPYFSNLRRFQLRNEPSQKNDERVILYSGALILRKGIDLLAKAFSDVVRDFPNLRLLVMGDGELRSSLRAQLSTCLRNVEFVGFKDWDELPKVYAEADVLCAPSRHDGWGLVVPESLASGLPVISTDRTGAALDLIQDEENGWMIKAGCLDDLKQALRKVAIVSNERLHSMRQKAIKSVNAHQLENGVSRFLEASASAIEDHTRKPTMKIIHFWAPDLNPTSGGIGAYSQVLSLSLARYRNLSLRLFPKDCSGIRLNRLFSSTPIKPKNKWLYSALYGGVLIYWAVRERPDLILTTHVNFSPVARMLKRFLAIPFVISLHGIDVWNLKHASRIRALREADWLLPVSEFTKRVVAKQQGIRAEKFFVLPDTVDGNRFFPAKKSKEIFDQYRIPYDRKIVLTVCHLSQAERYKGYDRVLRIWNRVLQSVPDAHYVLVGNGDDLEYIQQMVEKEKIHDHVTLAGFVPAHLLPEFYQSADVFVMPSTGEGFGIVFLEALASGLPVLAGNRDASSEPLLGGDIGVVVDPSDENALLRALISLLNKTHSNGNLFNSEYIRHRVINAYGLGAFQQKLTKFLEKIRLI
jgi:glycosyltransferase involved in cell wall biosynthesis